MANMPKRFKSKDNPYTIYFNNVKNVYFVSFRDGNNKFNEVEVSKEVFDVFNESELSDISQMHKDRKHKDYRSFDDSEFMEDILYSKTKEKYNILEDDIIQQIENEELHNLILQLPNIQKRRIIKYFFQDMTLQEIANSEHCSFQAIDYSIDQAIMNLKKKLKN